MDAAKGADRRDNLFDPVPDKARTRGRFTDKAKPFSAFIWADMNRLPIAAGLAALTAVAVVGSYLAWCPESPRFDNKPLRRQWWQRQRYHARHP